MEFTSGLHNNYNDKYPFVKPANQQGKIESQKNQPNDPLLGINYIRNFASVFSKDTLFTDIDPNDSHSFLFGLNTYSAKLLPEYSNELLYCSRTPHKAQDARAILEGKTKGNKADTVHHPLWYCRYGWICACCADREAKQEQTKILKGSRNWCNSADNRTLALLTLTIPHYAHTPLEDSLSSIKEALRGFKSGRKYQQLKKDFGIYGGITGTEIDYTEKNGFSPHTHELLFIESDKDYTDLIANLSNEVQERWYTQLATKSVSSRRGYGSMVTAIDPNHASYIAKPVNLGTASTQTVWSLLDDYSNGDDLAGKRFSEYALGSTGRSKIRWSRGLQEDLLGTPKTIH
jgi:hypothetical protein